MKRKFFLVGHNPNTLDDAIAYLEAGANGIEPDVHYHPELEDQFYLYDIFEPFNLEKRSLKKYLNGLKIFLEDKPNINLALIYFDLKSPYDYDLNLLYKYIEKHFSNYFPDICIMTTIGSSKNISPKDITFLLQVKDKQRSNQAVGVDEGTSAEMIDEYLKSKGINYTYGHGSALVNSMRFQDDVAVAINLRDAGNSFKLVSSWLLNHDDEIRAFLDLNVDIAVTDHIEKFKEIMNKYYDDKYELARRGYNPFEKKA